MVSSRSARARPGASPGGLIVTRVGAAAPCPSRVLLGACEDDRPFALISGGGDPALSAWSYAALEPLAQTNELAEARRAIARFEGGVDVPPFPGGAVGYVGYDAGWRNMPRPRIPRSDPLGMPHVCFGIYDAVYARSSSTGEGFIISQPTRDAEARAERLRAVLSRTDTAIGGGAITGALAPAISRAEHARRVGDALELIRAGEIYQVNLTHPLEARFAGSPEAAFLRLIEGPAPPFAAFFRVDEETCIVSGSPECFFDLDQRTRRISVYPIKGTRRRSPAPDVDRALANALLSDEKERAEHLMIVDLLRNDLGRIAQIGSVSAAKLAYVESFPLVHHLTSRVDAVLSARTTIEEVITALFPGGSITGVPKQRAMEVIDALEGAPRGVYTGAIGYFAADGSARTSIAIRTAQFARGELRFGVGGGIVADSVAEREWEETEIKAAALARALA